MISHIIMWNAAQGQDVALLHREAAAAAMRFTGIEGITKVDVWRGLRYQPEKDHELCMVIEMADRAALERYIKHPLHDEFKKVIAGRVCDRACFDAELP